MLLIEVALVVTGFAIISHDSRLGFLLVAMGGIALIANIARIVYSYRNRQ